MMRDSKVLLRLFLTILAVVGLPLVAYADPAAGKKPNILFVVLDDAGFSDFGAFGGEIETPAIDSLAKAGLKMTNFHTAASCSPSRDMLLTGTDNHVAGLGNMGELLEPEQKGKPGYEGYVNDRVATIAELLRTGGYHTYMAGKWHLGKGEHIPYKRGFDEVFALLEGGAGHFQETPAYPGEPTTYMRNDKNVGWPKPFYSTVYYTDRMIEFIDAHKDDSKPFFGYLAFTAPHDPLQAPREEIAKFKGRYDAGYEKIRENRVHKMMDLGIIPKGTVMYPRLEHVAAWDDLSPDAKKVSARKMEVYAAMISVIDEQIGRLIKHLRDIGAYDNTLIFVLSDNGANTDDIDFWDKDFIEKTYDNSLENIGNATSYPMYDGGWSQVSVGPLRLGKTYPTEGGIRTPLIISGPGVKRAGETSDALVHITDLTPTALEMAGVAHPKELDGKELAPMSGRSLTGLLAGKQSAVYGAGEAVGWEVLGRAALRIGNWKIVWIDQPYGAGSCAPTDFPCTKPVPGGWELYDLSTDLAEQNDLAKKMPEKLAELTAAWEKYVKDNGLIVVFGQGIRVPVAAQGGDKKTD